MYPLVSGRTLSDASPLTIFFPAFKLACALLSYETLNAKEIKLVLEGKEVPRKIAPLVQPSADPPMQEEPRETKAVDPKEIIE
jgi:hypothetical protein